VERLESNGCVVYDTVSSSRTDDLLRAVLRWKDFGRPYDFQGFPSSLSVGFLDISYRLEGCWFGIYIR
jgi:hypothetical protein